MILYAQKIADVSMEGPVEATDFTNAFPQFFPAVLILTSPMDLLSLAPSSPCVLLPPYLIYHCCYFAILTVLMSIQVLTCFSWIGTIFCHCEPIGRSCNCLRWNLYLRCNKCGPDSLFQLLMVDKEEVVFVWETGEEGMLTGIRC